MNRRMFFVAVLLVSAVSLTQGQQSGTARIRGSVVDAGTGSPVRRASLTLREAPPGRASWTALTDGSGAFEFPNLPAGRFLLAVSKGGYVAVGPGETSPSDRPRPLEVSAGATLDLPPVRLPRGGVITGRIVDEWGDTVPEVTVQAFRAQYMQGLRRFVSVRSDRTNDIGQFRLYGLQPGTYYVAAISNAADGNPHRFMEPGTEAVRGAGGLAPTFFPGTAVASDAQRIDVRPGAEVPAVDFALIPVRLSRISGTIVTSEGAPAGGYAVMLNPARADGALLGGSTVAETGADGSFTLSNVAPGEYRFDVRSKASVEAIAKSGRPGGSQAIGGFASVPVTVTGQDLEGLSIRLTTGRRMRGRLLVDGGAPLPSSLSALQVSVMAGSGGVSAVLLTASSRVAEDGTFEVHSLLGRRFVRVAGLPSGWALDSVRASGMDVTDDGIEILDDVDDVEVVVTPGPTRVTGMVVDASGAPVPEAAVIIFPEVRERRTAPHNRYLTSARADGEGRFEVRALPAATYLVAAVPALDDGEWAEPAYLDRLAAGAARVTLGKGATENVAARLQDPLAR